MSVSLSRPFPPFLLHTFSSFTHHCLFHSKSILWNSHSKHRYLSLRLSMATLTAASSSSSSYMCLTKVSSPPLPSTSFPISFPYHPTLPRDSSFSLASPVTSRTSVRFNPSFARDDEFGDFVEMKETSETRLYSLSPFPLLFIAALPGAGTVRSLFGPFVELVKSWNLPEWLVHWGHPGNMAVVLFAMGGYGTYLGFRIRYSDNVEEKANAKDLHPKLLGGMFFFFALGATGGITSLLTSDKPIFESPHAVTGFIGLALLTVQTLLPSLFENNPGLRNVHGILGSGIMTLFLIHAALGLQLGLSY